MEAVKKAKLLYVLKILKEQTDEYHGISLPDILKELDQYGIHAERKSIYDDINTLIDFGFSIEKRKKKRFLYHYTGRRLSGFQVALLNDALESASFVSEGQRQELLEIVSAVSLEKPEQSPIYRPKPDEVLSREQVAFVYESILERRCITFTMKSWQLEKKKKGLKECKQMTETIVLFPLKLIFQGSRSILVGVALPEGRYCHYDIRGMQDVMYTEDTFAATAEDADLQAYMRKLLPKAPAKQEEVTIEFARYLFQEVLMDFFAQSKTVTVKSGKYDACITGTVALTAHFYAKLFQYEDTVQLLAPKKAVEHYKSKLKQINKMYKS